MNYRLTQKEILEFLNSINEYTTEDEIKEFIKNTTKADVGKTLKKKCNKLNSNVHDDFKSITLLQLLNKEYIVRKYQRDIIEKSVDEDEINKHFIIYSKCVHVYYKNKYKDYYYKLNNIYVPFPEVSNDFNVFFDKSIRCLNMLLINLIQALHYETNEDPKYDITPVYIGMELKDDLKEFMFSCCRESLLFIKDTCLTYGLYLDCLETIIPGTELIELFNTPKKIKPFNRFVRLDKDKDKDVPLSFKFVSKLGKTFFEAEHKDFYYFYCNTQEKNVDFDLLIKKIKIKLTATPKKGFKKVEYFSSTPNIQICVNKRNKDFEIEYSLRTIRNNLNAAQLYYSNLTLGVKEEDYSAHSNSLDGYHANISYPNRAIGLFLWDCVHLEGRKLSQCINALLEHCYTSFECNDKEDLIERSEEDEKIIKTILEQLKKNPEMKNPRIKLMANSYYKYYTLDRDKKDIANNDSKSSLPDYETFTYEYYLAKECIDKLKTIPSRSSKYQ